MNEPILDIITDIKTLNITTDDEKERKEFEFYKKSAMDKLFTLYTDFQELGDTNNEN